MKQVSSGPDVAQRAAMLPSDADQASVLPCTRPVPAVPARLLRHARILPSRADILPLLPKGGVVVEVGVGLGDFSQALLDVCAPREFVAIDIFTLHLHHMVWDRTAREVFDDRTHREFYEARFAAPLAAGRMRVIEADSVAALASLADASASIVYVDADHSYAAVSAELAVVRRKVRQDGWVVLNDYIMSDVGGGHAPYGVIHAAHEFMLAEDWEMACLALHPLMYCDVALRKAGSCSLDEA